MPCGKRPLVKIWDKPRELKSIKPSRYQQNEASVKVHWIRLIKELELAYKDDKFWETQSKTVRELVGPIIFERLTKIFDLTLDDKIYYPEPEPSVVVDSEKFYEVFKTRESVVPPKGVSASICDFSEPVKDEGEEGEEEEEGSWTATSTADSASQEKTLGHKASHSKSQILMSSKSLTRDKSRVDASFKSFSKFVTKSKVMSRTFTKPRVSSVKLDTISESFSDVIAFTEDDVIVHAKSYDVRDKSRTRSDSPKGPKNPHFSMLYCNESEVDMIKWPSKYKTKKFQVSASDEYSMKADVLTKEISNEFYQWWVDLGSDDYKSEIKRMEDIEGLFQIWFNEHASRSLVLDPQILPCVLQTIANSVGVPKTACAKALKRQIAWDIQAETSPARTLAFNTPLPHNLKHIPPKNDTAESWHAIRIPEDLRSMSAIWGDISHLTSTKAFQKWLEQRPYMPMPPCLKALGTPGDKKQPFVVPSDYVIRDRSVEAQSSQELNLPVSQFSMEIKDVLSKLLND